MRKLLIMLLFVLTLTASGQEYNQMEETICITPYIPDETQLPDDKSAQLLLDKLTQIVTLNGLSNKGYENRFVISAHVYHISKSRTATIPARTVVKMSLTLYVGDGEEGTLFSSVSKELKGVGNNYEEACHSALYKIRTNDKDIVQCLDIGKSRILSYYDNIGENIIQQAESMAANADYDAAISSLFTIPMQCVHYQRAQDMIAKFNEERIETNNKNLLVKARATWYAHMDENGAEQAMSIMNEVIYPSKDISNQINKLCAEISVRLKSISDKKWQMDMQQMQNRHKEEMAHIQSDKERSLAYIKSAASVAKALAENQPKVVYRIYHWW